MGPQLYRCGNLTISFSLARLFIRFNGAATLSLRKSNYFFLSRTSFYTLQWGRNFIVAEMNLSYQLGYLGQIASMGPQLYRCGNVEVYETTGDLSALLQWGRNFIVAEIDPPHDIEPAHLAASMGPQLYRCGNDILLILDDSAGTVLQWGRNFIVAEMGLCPGRYVTHCPASMGPQLYRCGN